jgi:hypothetical protein
MAYLCDKCAFIYQQNGKLVIQQYYIEFKAHAPPTPAPKTGIFFLSTETYPGA